MAQLTTDRNTQHRDGDLWHRPVAGGVLIHAGALVVLQSGLAKPGHAAAGLVAAGRAEHRADNRNGGDGAVRVEVRRGTFNFASAAGADTITAAHLGQSAYVADDQTVALTDGGGTRSLAGRIMDVDARGVWVEIR